MEEQTVVMTNGDHSVIMDEVETIKQVDVETSTVAETRDRSMSAGDTPGQCESVRMLEQLMQQHKTVYSGESLSKHFHGDILRVATKCWDQVNLSVHTALEAKFVSVLEEFTVKEKLTELDKLWDESDSDELAWRPSGTPGADCVEAEGVVVRQEVIPRFQEESKQSKVSRTLCWL
ncbi:uncharacterized protein LOC135338766 isoform X2 [Halichondria panicea]|uniref:uncharacterized protein LOC135338766 isoform X2 n=1 Tax=Halichondria panicea TaxID=6063 RepID=UPI00312B9AFD